MSQKTTLVQARISASVAKDFNDFVEKNCLRRASVIERALEMFMAEYDQAGNKVPIVQIVGRVAHPNTEGYKIPPAPVQPESGTAHAIDPADFDFSYDGQ